MLSKPLVKEMLASKNGKVLKLIMKMFEELIDEAGSE